MNEPSAREPYPARLWGPVVLALLCYLFFGLSFVYFGHAILRSLGFALLLPTVLFCTFILPAVFIYTWIRNDAAIQGAEFSRVASFLAAVFPIIGVPLYLFMTRPFRRALHLSFRAYLLFGCASLITIVLAELSGNP